MIRRARLRGFALPLHRPLETAHGPIENRRGILIELEDEEGRVGVGEATPLPEFGTESLAAARRALESRLVRLVAGDGAAGGLLRDAPRAIDAIRHSSTPAADFGVETARVDLASRRDGVSFSEVLADWGRTGRALPSGLPSKVKSQALIGGLAPRQVEASARAALEAGFLAFKLKLAVRPGRIELDEDLARIAALRSVVGPDALLRLDANEAFRRDEAATALSVLEAFSIDYVEQPLDRDDLEGMAFLAANAPVAVAADESLLGAGLKACLEARAVEILIVKPAAIGGLERALALAAHARREGVRLVWSTLIDGVIGRRAALAVAAATSDPDEVHGLGTAQLLAKDLASSADLRLETPEQGRISVPDRPGLGFDPVLSSDVLDPTDPIFECEA